MAKLGGMKNINPVYSIDDDDFFAVGFVLLWVMLALACAFLKHIDCKEAAKEAEQHKQELQAMVKEAVREEMGKEKMAQ